MDSYGSTPDTLRVKQDILRHREALDALKSNFSIKSSVSPSKGDSMQMPSFDNLKTPKAVSFKTSDARPMSGASTSKESLTDLIMYKDSALSFLVVILGAVALSFGHFVLSGAHGMTLLSAVSYSMLGALAINFLRSLISFEQAGDLTNSHLVQNLKEIMTQGIQQGADLHDQYLNARDPKTSLRVAAGLWGAAIIGRYMSIWNVITFGFIFIFSVPITFKTHEDAIMATYRQVSQKVKGHWVRLGLSRKQQAAILSFGLVVLWMNSSWSSRVVGALVGALMVRCNLKPAEVVALRQHAEPYTSVVKKRAARLSIAATDFAYRTLGAKAHAR